MPTILCEGPYRFFCFSNDRNEPVHVHVGRDDKVAKFWLEPVEMQRSGDLSQSDLRKISRIINREKDHMIGRWNGFFNG